MTDDIDLVTLGRAIWRAKGWIVGISLAVGFLTFVSLSMMRPQYTAETRILIENEQSVYRQPAGSTAPVRSLDEQAIQSQVQVLTSRDLALQVVRKLDLINNPTFAKDSGVGLIGMILKQIGLTGTDKKSEAEKAADAFMSHLIVYQREKSSVIAINYTSGDPQLAADAANALAEAYINWQRDAQLEQTKDATAWLQKQIDSLRTEVAESEAAVENFRAKEGIYAGSNNVDLSAQQLSELNSQLIMAKAQKSEAEARARLIRQMLQDNGDIDATPEVLKSPLISRLIEQRVQVQRQLAELSATLLPSHPRIEQLNSELADVRRQIRDEARKIVKGLESEAQVAGVRVNSLSASLGQAKTEASGESAAEIKLRALERDAKSKRDLLESYLARYSDASARHDIGAVPSNASIISKAYPPLKPSFPKKLPITLLVTVAVGLLMLAFIVARELIRATPNASGRRSAYPVPVEPAMEAATEPAAASAPSLFGQGSRPPVPAAARRKQTDESPQSDSLASRIRQGQTTATAAQPNGKLSAESAAKAAMGTPSALDLYLRKRRQGEHAGDTSGERKTVGEKGAVVHSVDAVSEQLDAKLAGVSPRSILIVPATAMNALPEAIQIARKRAEEERVVLLDIAQGQVTVSDFLGLERIPGYRELAAGEAAFEDVIQVDQESELQVIPAGDPEVTPENAQASFLRIFDALSHVYDCVVIHADRPQAVTFQPALEGMLSAMVALFAPDTAKSMADEALADFASFDCPVLIYERRAQTVKAGARHPFGRVAAT
ncbi:exopolysaccharide transport family protein [Methyloligella sp. 2.7D]|uniref:exopolysaccharide transport family protein n=1 Tax=unclassified Methyloligella TaxID=2625955 RepID=UPI00157DE59E|nr:exopolysaccharide transport family protein [Methyloligella sp. GL2]QKP77582.1 hypothetical protein HT051_09065 [Methyloligella sp. GL2]